MKIKQIPNEAVTAAIVVATQKHSSQVRWNGDPYILHPLRVMGKMKTNLGRCVAVLHDILEDTPTSKEELLAQFGSDITNCVCSLSKNFTSSYEEYIEELLTDPVAIAVKIADIEDNLNIWDLSPLWRQSTEITEKHRQRMNKYLKTHQILTSHRLHNLEI